jgi:HSP20 family protein
MKGKDFAESVGSEVLKRAGRAASRFQEESPLPVDMLEGDDEYLLVFDAPGADASDVQVSYEGSEVHVRVDRFRGFREGFEMVFPGRGLTLEGSATLPEDAVVDAESARAELKDDGTLYVFLPKRGDDATTIDVTASAPEEHGDEPAHGDDHGSDDDHHDEEAGDHHDEEAGDHHDEESEDASGDGDEA